MVLLGASHNTSTARNWILLQNVIKEILQKVSGSLCTRFVVRTVCGSWIPFIWPTNEQWQAGLWEHHGMCTCVRVCVCVTSIYLHW